MNRRFSRITVSEWLCGYDAFNTRWTENWKKSNTENIAGWKRDASKTQMSTWKDNTILELLVIRADRKTKTSLQWNLYIKSCLLHAAPPPLPECSGDFCVVVNASDRRISPAALLSWEKGKSEPNYFDIFPKVRSENSSWERHNTQSLNRRMEGVQSSSWCVRISQERRAKWDGLVFRASTEPEGLAARATFTAVYTSVPSPPASASTC